MLVKMKLLKKLSIIVLMASVLMSMPGVFTNLNIASTVQAATGIKINKTKKTLNVGKKYTLKITGTSKKVKWTSSNKKVATVNSKGKVTAKKKGTATITAKVGGKKYKCKITVKNLHINKSNKTLNIGDGYSLKIVGTSKKVKWKSSNSSIATVNSYGRVIAKKAGTAVITGKVDNKKYKCNVVVKNIAFSNVEVKTTILGEYLLAELKNNNDYAVDIRIDGTFYDKKGKKICDSNIYNFALEAGSTSIGKFLCRKDGLPSTYSSYHLKLGENNNANNRREVTKVDDKDKRHAANMVLVESVTKGSNQYTVKVKNKSYWRLDFVNVGIVFYDNNGKIIGAETKTLQYYRFYVGAINELKFDFPKDSNGKTLNPTSYKVYVNHAYSYLK